MTTPDPDTTQESAAATPPGTEPLESTPPTETQPADVVASAPDPAPDPAADPAADLAAAGPIDDPAAEPGAAAGQPDAASAKSAQRPRALAALALGLVVGLLVGAAFWAFGPQRTPTAKAGAPSPAVSPPASVAPGTCAWLPRAAGAAAQQGVRGPNPAWNPRPVVAVGAPKASEEHRGGAATLTLTTDRGPIVIAMDATRTPCTVTSLAHLAAAAFYNGAQCSGSGEVLNCGDRDPDYTWADENTSQYPNVLSTTVYPVPDMSDIKECLDHPDRCSIGYLGRDGVVVPNGAPVTVQATLYPAGAVLLANSGPGTNGGVFEICTKEVLGVSGLPAFGTVSRGLELLGALGDGAELTVRSVTVTFG